MAAFLNNCRFTPTAAGTTDWSYSAAVTGYQSPAAAGVVNGTKYKFLAMSADQTVWEISEGAYNSTAPGTFARTTVLYNSSGTGSASGQSGAGTKINFAAAPQVAIIGIKEDLISIEEPNSFTQTQKAQALSNIGGIAGSFANKFRNGTMDGWQRGTASITLSSGYTADGWIVAGTGAQVTAAPAAGRLLTANSLKVTGNTSVTDALVKQRIEGQMAAPLTSQTVTVQAEVFNNTGGAITPTLTVKHANAVDNWGASTTDVNAVNLQSCANGAWTLVAYTFAASASAANGLEVTFDFGNNFSANTKSIQITELDIRATPGLAVGLNSAPPAPELRPISVEQPINLRYYFRRTAQSASDVLNIMSAFSATQAWGMACDLPQPMRANPTVSISSIGHLNLNGSACTAGTFDASNQFEISTFNGLTATGLGSAVGAAVILRFNTTSGYIEASAEL